MTKLHCCLLCDQTDPQLVEKLEQDLSGRFEFHVMPVNESPRQLKTQLLEMEKLHLVLLICDDIPKPVQSLIHMLKKKRHFASAYVGDTNLQGPRFVDLHEPLSSLENTQAFHRVLTFLAEAAQHSQQDGLLQKAKIQLLTQLTQLTRTEISTDRCVSLITDSLTMLCNAEHVYIYDESLQCRHRTNADCVTFDPPASIEQAIDEKKVKVQFDENSPDIVALRNVQENIAGSMTFPIVCNDRVLRVIQCYLPQDMLDYITLETISLVEQACIQLRIILERLEAQKTLEQQHEELRLALRELQETKAQLYQRDKLAAIGELAAGLAHEINNPLAFIASNFQSLIKYVDTMADVLSEHGNFLNSIKEMASDQIDFSQIDEKRKQSDVQYILEDVDELIGDSRDGLNRIRDIIDNLLSFSRKNGVEKQEYNLHEGIQSTLKVLNSKLKHGIVVTTDFANDRTITCNPGLMNQVFLNVVQNAADAMGGKGEILIRTRYEPDRLLITIRDNGPGIAEDVIARVFDPFFTTKEAGKGTGLGLSISHSIVEQHEGSITIESEVGEFTEFTIALPLLSQAA